MLLLTFDAEAAGIQCGTLGSGHIDLQTQLLQRPAVGLGHILAGSGDVSLWHKQAAKAHVDVLEREENRKIKALRVTRAMKTHSLTEAVHKQLTKQHLQFLGTPACSSLGDLLQLFDSLTEVCHPLDHSHGGWNCVATPAAREDAWGERKTVVYQIFPQRTNCPKTPTCSSSTMGSFKSAVIYLYSFKLLTLE